MISLSLGLLLMRVYIIYLGIDKMQEKNPVLNWKKCHFIVKSGIVLGHIVSEKVIKVDKAKEDLISKLPPPKTVWEV